MIEMWPLYIIVFATIVVLAVIASIHSILAG